MRVVWSPPADRQVDEAVEYIAPDDPTAALEWLERLLERVKALARFPDSGRVVPEIRREDIREIIVSPYRVMYRRKDDMVKIAAIRHEARAVDEREVSPKGESGGRSAGADDTADAITALVLVRRPETSCQMVLSAGQARVSVSGPRAGP